MNESELLMKYRNASLSGKTQMLVRIWGRVQRIPELLAVRPPVLRRHDFATGFGKGTWENLLGKLMSRSGNELNNEINNSEDSHKLMLQSQQVVGQHHSSEEIRWKAEGAKDAGHLSKCSKRNNCKKDDSKNICISKTSQVRKTKLKILRDDTSRMMGDYHVRFCERLAGETPACLLGLQRFGSLISFLFHE